MRNALPPLVVAIAFLAGWQLLHAVTGCDTISAPAETVAFLARMMLTARFWLDGSEAAHPCRCRVQGRPPGNSPGARRRHAHRLLLEPFGRSDRRDVRRETRTWLCRGQCNGARRYQDDSRDRAVPGGFRRGRKQ